MISHGGLRSYRPNNGQVRTTATQEKGIARTHRHCWHRAVGFQAPENCREFWLLRNRARDAIAPIPPSRWSAEAFYDADPTTPGKTYCREGGFLDHIDQFDPEFFGIAPREAKFIDPQQRVFLEVVWAALEDGPSPLSTLSGSYWGVCGDLYQ
jgi:acyl transferase domain-containing protein